MDIAGTLHFLHIGKTGGTTLSDVGFTRQNVTMARPSLSQIPFDVRRLIEDKVRLDRQLYQWVMQRFRRQVRQLGSAFALERAAFGRLSARRSWWTWATTAGA